MDADSLSEDLVMRISRGLSEPKWLLNERLRAFYIFKKLLSEEKNPKNFCSSAAKKLSGKFEGVHADSLYSVLESKDGRDAIAQNMFKNRMGNPIRGIDEAFVGAFFTECNFFGTDPETELRTKFSTNISDCGGVFLNFFIVSSGTELDCSLDCSVESSLHTCNSFGINEFYVFDEADVLFHSKNTTNCINLFAVNKAASATVCSLHSSTTNSRTEITLFGENSEANVKESFALDVGVANLFVSVSHLASNTDSSVTIHGALDGNARASVRGKIVIPKNIKSAASFLEERVLLLSEEASAEAIPLLEIESNDVDVGHSASVSDITDEQRFYAGSRGLDEAKIKRMIFEGVVGDGMSEL